jgi:hypothetical protein
MAVILKGQILTVTGKDYRTVKEHAKLVGKSEHRVLVEALLLGMNVPRKQWRKWISKFKPVEETNALPKSGRTRKR